MRAKLRGAALAISLVANVVVAAAYLDFVLVGCAERPNGRPGALTRDAEVGRFEGTDRLFVLPRGPIVREASATAADWL